MAALRGEPRLITYVRGGAVFSTSQACEKRGYPYGPPRRHCRSETCWVSHRIYPDPARADLIRQVFELYAFGTKSLKEDTASARSGADPSQHDKERQHRTQVLRLQQQYAAAQKIDAAYDDRLAGRITDEYWARRSGEWEAELVQVRGELAPREVASHDYSATGFDDSRTRKKRQKRLRFAESHRRATVARHRAIELRLQPRNLTPAHRKPFDLLARGNETEDWLGGRDSNPDNVVQRGRKRRR